MTQPDFELDEKALQIVEEALDIAPEQRLAFIEQNTGDNQALRRRAKYLLAQALAADEEAPVTGQGLKALLDLGQPSQIGNYKIQNEIGRGGMGVVYRGKRTGADFDHEVAIKLVAVTEPSEKLTKRLRDERRLLASLQHPNIAQFYDGGETEDGLPYFIMEYVKGQSLHHYLREKQPSSETCFELFGQMCNGVAYAHKNLIIHRDLAPGNILVSHENEVKIIDFGVSHTIGSTTMETRPSMAHTAGFTSPERLAGNVATTISDIFSLGELLKYMTKHLSLPRKTDINAIIDKATAETPDQRYQSVELLQNDLGNYLEAKPVDAMGANWQYRWKRNVALHKYAVAGLTSAFTAIIIAALIFANLYFRAVEAEKQASNRFNEVRELANFMLFDLYDALTPITGTTSARESVADKALVYLDSLNASIGTPLSLQLETLQGYRRLADISGIPGGPNLGRREQAQVALNKALNGLITLKEKHSKNADVNRAVLQTAYSYAVFEYLANDDSPATIEKAMIAENAFNALVTLQPPTVNDYKSITDAMVIHGNAYIWEKEGDKGLPIFKKAIKISEQAQKDYPDNVDIDVMVAKLLADYGDAQSRHIDLVGGSYEDAQSSLNDGIERLQNIVSQNPQKSSLSQILATLLWKRALLLYGIYESEQALPDIETALTMYQQLYDKDKNDFGAYRAISVIQLQYARTLVDLERFDEAVNAAQEGVFIREVLISSQNDNTGYRRDHADALITFAEILYAGNQKEKSCAPLQRGLDIMTELEKQGKLQAYQIENAIETDAPVMLFCQTSK